MLIRRYILSKNLNVALVLLIANVSSGQTFTAVTTGEIVTDAVMSWGCAWGDFDDDGYLDLFVGNAGVNALYRGNGDSTFVKITAEPFATDNGSCRGGGWGDYDNDGYLDLFVPNNGGTNFLYHNDGPDSGFTFTKITGDPMVNEATDHRGSSWADYDNDGSIDMFIARNGNDHLFHNNGNGTFTRIDTGSVATDGRFSIGPTWCDYDNDGDIDLHVANMNAQGNLLYVNEGSGLFTRVTTGPVVTDLGNSASGSWGDFDNDSDFDLFVANAPGTNFFYINNGPDSGYTFTKVTTGPIATDGGTSYGSTWADFDNDGDLDLFVANNTNPNFYYRNDGPPDYGFTKLATINLATDPGVSWGSCVGDIESDGDLDVFIANSARNSLYLNDGNGNNWTNIKCKGTTSNRSAIGARVSVKAVIDGLPRWQVRDVVGQTTYYSQSSLNVSFGLGNAAVIDSVVIQWPSGMIDEYAGVEVNHYATAIEGGGITVGVLADSPELPRSLHLLHNYPNPFNPSTIIGFDLSTTSGVTLTVFDIQGRRIRDLIVNQEFPSGKHEIRFEGGGLASGTYLYRITTNPPARSPHDWTTTRKMTLIK